MATIAASVAQPQVGSGVGISGSGFTPGAVVTVSVLELGFSSEITADAAGFVGSDDVADHATTTGTLSGGSIVADEAVTLGAVTYVFKASVAATANQVKLGSDDAGTLANLKAAINLESNSPAKYGTATVVHPTIACRSVDATHIYLYAKTGGTGGNSLASTTTAAHLAFTGATLSGGSASTGVSSILWVPTKEGTVTLEATDGTNTAVASVRIWSAI